MSRDRVDGVWVHAPSTISSAELVVLLCLADHENETTGQLNPSMATLARECRMSERQVLRHVQTLRGLPDHRKVIRHQTPLLAVATAGGGRKTTNHYRILLPKNSDIGGRVALENTVIGGSVSANGKGVIGGGNPDIGGADRAETLTSGAGKGDIRASGIIKNPTDESGIGIGNCIEGVEGEDLGAPLPRRLITKAVLAERVAENPDLDVEVELEKFRNYPRKKRANDEVRAFDNWLKNARRFQTTPRRNGTPTPSVVPSLKGLNDV